MKFEKTILGCLLYLCLAIIYRKLKSCYQKHLLSIAILAASTSILNPILLIHLLTSVGVSYNIIKFNYEAYWMPLAVTSFSVLNSLFCLGIFDYLQVSTQIYKLFMIQMIMKVTSYAWSIYDEIQRKQADSKSPQPRFDSIEYFGYISYFPSSFFGPLITMNEYRSIVNKKFDFDVLQIALPMCKTVIKLLIPCAVFIKCGNMFFDSIPSNSTMLQKLLYYNLFGFGIRFRNYILYNFCDGCNLLCGYEATMSTDNSHHIVLENLNLWNPSLVIRN